MKLNRRQLRRLIENHLKEQNTVPTVTYGDRVASMSVPAGSEASFKIDATDPNTHGVSVKVIKGDHTKISLKLPGVNPGVTRDDGEKLIMQQFNLSSQFGDIQSCTIKNGGMEDATVEITVHSGY